MMNTNVTRNSSTDNLGFNFEGNTKILEESSFKQVLYRERKRSERTKDLLLLLTLDLSLIERMEERESILSLLSESLERVIRDTDVSGWLKTGSLLGIVFASIRENSGEAATEMIDRKVRDLLKEKIKPSVNNKIRISIFKFPDVGANMDGKGCGGFNKIFYPEILHATPLNRISAVLKRVMDIVVSLVALVLFSPIFLIVSVLIKTTSPGPVLFRQTRLGQFGKPFTFLKFRSMNVNNDDSIHREFMKSFIVEKSNKINGADKEKPVFKIVNDPRITPVGNFIRKTSIDELPQFLNVLRGEMSLVGPRPPIPYEVESYEAWHHYRINAKKPGITGLWQVLGRSQTSFDSMVRLDLQYIRNWSLWLDLKLILATPFAVLRRKGAY